MTMNALKFGVGVVYFAVPFVEQMAVLVHHKVTSLRFDAHELVCITINVEFVRVESIQPMQKWDVRLYIIQEKFPYRACSRAESRTLPFQCSAHFEGRIVMCSSAPL